MMLAEDTYTPPVLIAAWLGCAVFVIMGLNALLKLVDRFKGKSPHPPNQSLGQSVEELDRRVTALEDDQETLRREINALPSKIIADLLNAKKLLEALSSHEDETVRELVRLLKPGGGK
jgi:hypothetical protein